MHTYSANQDQIERTESLFTVINSSLETKHIFHAVQFVIPVICNLIIVLFQILGVQKKITQKRSMIQMQCLAKQNDYLGTYL